MPIFLPFALGGLALAALGLGVKRALEELSPRPSFPEGSRAHQAWTRHQEAVEALRAARQRVKERARAYGERQELAWRETVEPFRALLERLERWEHARATEVLTPGGAAALRALPQAPAPRAAWQAWALLGVGAQTPPSLFAMLEWLERGWLAEEAPAVVVGGVSLYPAASCSLVTSNAAEAARALETACEELGRAVAFLDAVHARLGELDARVATLQGRASAQLEYLDAASFEEARPEPRERLGRLGALMGPLAEALCLPVLKADGQLAPRPAPLAE